MYANDSAPVGFVKPMLGATASAGRIAPRHDIRPESTYAFKKQEHAGSANREVGMTVLLIAFASIAFLWICVLLGSPLFGSNH